MILGVFCGDFEKCAEMLYFACLGGFWLFLAMLRGKSVKKFEILRGAKIDTFAQFFVFFESVRNFFAEVSISCGLFSGKKVRVGRELWVVSRGGFGRAEDSNRGDI